MAIMAMMMMEMVAGKKGKDESFKRWIQDGTVLAKVVIMDHEMLIMGVNNEDGCRQEVQIRVRIYTIFCCQHNFLSLKNFFTDIP